MENNTLSKEDFNLTKEYELFDIIYTVSKQPYENKVQAWTIIGHILDSNKEKRCFDYEINSYPISVFVLQNEKYRLSQIIDNVIISRDRNEVIEKKKEILDKYFQSQLNELKLK